MTAKVLLVMVDGLSYDTLLIGRDVTAQQERVLRCTGLCVAVDNDGIIDDR